MENKKNPKNKKKIHNTNVVSKVTLENLCERHNALARYIGVPCIVEPSEVINGAAKYDGSILPCKEYMCCRIDLRPFKGHFKSISFRAVSNGSDIVFGFIKSKDGKVESVAGSDISGSGTVVLPLSEESAALFATVPAKNGRPLWRDITAKLLCDGMVVEVNDALNYLLGKVRELESKVDNEILFKKTEISLSIA
ncbi:MAG: hypothetical protein IKZ37_02585 [Bacteroidaceae bacterium]|nr:hypothetical protein [Bacteroidaceae bacterium]